MLFAQETFIGVDPTPGSRSITYAALDADLSLVKIGQGDLSAVLAFLNGQQKAVVAIHGPGAPSKSIMTSAKRRNEYLIPMSKGRPGNMRVAEYTLRQMGASTYQTPARKEDAPGWMRTSYKLHSNLLTQGYVKYQPDVKTDRLLLEVIAETFFHTWLEGSIHPPNSFLGRIQRQLALYEAGLKIPDPMDFFEEITRFRLLRGAVPEKHVYTQSVLQAFGAAYAAWLSQKQPEDIMLVGVEEEGQIAAPAQLAA